MRYLLAVAVVFCVLVGIAWVSQAQEKTPSAGDKQVAATAEEDDTKFQESLNNLGLSAGYASKCNEKETGTVETFLLQSQEIANRLVRLFGTDAAFRFVFFTGVGAAGGKLDPAKCSQYTTDWTNFVKKYPEIERAGQKEKK
jgi:hypothetical protein